MNLGRPSDALAHLESAWSGVQGLGAPLLGWPLANAAALMSTAYLMDPESARAWCRRGLGQPRFDSLAHPHDALVDQLVLALAEPAPGPFRLTLACRPALRAARGCVVNLASMSALRAAPFVPGYGAAKAGLVQATVNLANAWARDGIRVNAVAPGVIETRMTAPMQAAPEIVAEQQAHIPMGRFGTPAEVVPAILFLATREAAYVTGHTLLVDGGYATV